MRSPARHPTVWLQTTAARKAGPRVSEDNRNTPQPSRREPPSRRNGRRTPRPGTDVVRVAYPDLIGVDRGRDILVSQLPGACGHGLAFCRAVYHTTPRGDVVPVAGGLDAGLPDISVRPDLDTLQALPWEPGVAWCLGDTFDPATGEPVAESPRALLRRVLGRHADRPAGLHAVVGPELEFFLLRRRTRPRLRLAAYGERHRQRLRRGTQRRPGRSSAAHPAAPWPSSASTSSRATTSSPAGSSRSTCGTPTRSTPPTAPSGSRPPSRNWPARRASWPRSWPSRSTTRAAPASTCTSRLVDDDGRNVFDDPAANDGLSDDRTARRSPAPRPRARRWPR